MLWIEPNEKPWGPDYLQLGFAGQSDSRGETDFSVQAIYRRTWVDRRGAEWLTVARFGATRELASSYYQPWSVGSGWFVEPHLSLSSTPQQIFVDDLAVAKFRIDRRHFELRAGWQEARAMARVALVSGSIATRPVLGPLNFDTLRSNVNGVRLLLAWDQLDEVDFPRSGQAARLDHFVALRALGAEGEYRRLGAEWLSAHSWGDHTLRLRARWTRIDKNEREVQDFASVGGFLNLSGYAQGQFIGSGVTLLAAGYQRRLLQLPQPFGTGLYGGFALETASIREPLGVVAPSIRRSGIAAYVGVSTGLGPIYLGLGLGQQGQRILHLMLGRP